MDELVPLSVFLVKKGGGGDKILFRYPYSRKKNTSNVYFNSEPLSWNRFSNDRKTSKKEGPMKLKSDNLPEFLSKDLSSVFAVNPELCDMKFELKINDVRFVGHPINLEITAEEAKYLPPSVKSDSKSNSPLIMFHVVFALLSSAKYSVVQCFHDLSQLIGIAIKSEERRVGYLTSQSKIMSQILDEAASSSEEQKESPFVLCLDKSQLAQELKQIFVDVSSSGIANTKINKFIEVSMCIPHKVHRKHHPKALVEPEAIFQCLEALRPYHTILPLYDEKELLDGLPLDASPSMRKVIQHTTPLKSFRTLASDADVSLNQVFQVAGHLLYWGKVTVIYPLCETNVYIISPYNHNPFGNPILDEEFAEKFPGPDCLKTVLSWFSLPTSLSQRSPPHSLPGHQENLAKIVVWCLQKNLLLQQHTYVTLAVNDDLTITLPDPVKEKKERLERYVTKDSEDILTELSFITLEDEPPRTPQVFDEASSKLAAQNEILHEFNQEDKDSILAIPASDNIEDLKFFVRVARYFRGIYHLEEIMYYENIRRSQLLQILDKFKDVLICHMQEDTSVTMYFSQNDLK